MSFNMHGGLPEIGDHNAFQRPGAGDDKLFVVFYMGVIPNESKSVEAGRPIYDDVECCRIIIPGDKNAVIDRPADRSDKTRFATQYALFRQGVKEEDQVSGTRLSDWPMVGRAQAAELKHVGLVTVEQLADVRDDIVAKIPGLQSLKQAAGIWLQKAKGTAEAAKAAKLIDDQANRIDALEKVVRDQADRLEAAMARQKA